MSWRSRPASRSACACGGTGADGCQPDPAASGEARALRRAVEQVALERSSAEGLTREPVGLAARRTMRVGESRG